VASFALSWHDGLWMSARGQVCAKLVLYQAPLLLPLLGVGPYLLPRFFGHRSAHCLADSRTPPPGWWPRFAICTAAGVVILVSIGIEAGGSPRFGMTMRAGAFLGVYLLEVPLFWRAPRLTTPGTAVRIAVLSVLGGLLWAAFEPARRVGILHLLFVSGVGFAMLGVAVRVVLGHAGRRDLLEGRIVWLRVLAGLVVLAAATRVSAEYLPEIRLSHLDYAAATWGMAALLWLWKLRRFFLAREDERTSTRSPKARKRSANSAPCASR
jgi:hypothetical protein